MNAKCFHIVLAIWLFAAIPIGFSESFSNRPTAGELYGIVISGKECLLGVNERCLATQYATNPVSYRVSSPFVKTNYFGWYLDQNTMGTMAAKIKSLVPNYVDPDTVYVGTTNILTLTVSNLWLELGIGDHSNKFTQTFASGTNAAVFGDSPWRIYQENLDERYDVLNACSMALFDEEFDLITDLQRGGEDGTYAAALASYSAASWLPASWGYHPAAWSDKYGGGPYSIIRIKRQYKLNAFMSADVGMKALSAVLRVNDAGSAASGVSTSVFWAAGAPGNLNEWLFPVNKAYPVIGDFPITTSLIGDNNDPVPDLGSSASTWIYGWMLYPWKVLIDWNFQYCK